MYTPAIYSFAIHIFSNALSCILLKKQTPAVLVRTLTPLPHNMQCILLQTPAVHIAYSCKANLCNSFFCNSPKISRLIVPPPTSPRRTLSPPYFHTLPHTSGRQPYLPHTPIFSIILLKQVAISLKSDARILNLLKYKQHLMRLLCLLSHTTNMKSERGFPGYKNLLS